MKPVHLKMTAFGPFADTHEVDFIPLHEQGLFLVHGKTGSGKTTILDAISVALFGKTTGGERDAKDMRSKWAEPEQQAVIEFVFEVKDKRYRSTVKPAFLKPGNKNETSAKYLLELVNKTDQTSSFLAEKKEEHYEKITEITGFSKEQFSQVVVLPQGKFRKVITEAGEERETIYSELFQLQRFEQYENKIKEQNKELTDQFKSTREKLAEQFELYEVENHDDMLLEKDNISKKVEKLEKKKLNISKTYNEQNDLLARQTVLLQHYQASDAAKEKQKHLSAQKESMAQKKEFAKKLEAAAGLHDALKHFTELHSDENLLKQKKKQASEELNDTEKAYKQIDAEFSKINNLREENEQDNIKIEKLNNNIKIVKKIIEDKDLQKKLTQKKAEQAESLKNIEKSINESVREIQSCKGQLEQIEKDMKNHNDKKLEKFGLSPVLENLENILSCHDEIQKIERSVQSQKKDLTIKEKEKTAIETMINDLQKQEKLYFSHLLAKELKPGDACPVCGSLDHPEMAKENGSAQADELESSREQLNHLNQTIAEIKAGIESKTADILKIDKQYHQALKAFNKLIKDVELKKENIAKVKELKKHYKQKLTEIDKELNNHEKLEQQKDEQNARYENLITDKEEKQQTKNNLQVKLAELDADLKNIKLRIAENTKISGSENTSAEKLLKEIEKKTQTVNERKNHIENTEKEHRRLSDKVSSAKKEITLLEQSLTELQNKKKSEKQQLLKRIKQKDLIDIDHLENLVKHLDELPELKTEIEQYNYEKKNIENTIKELESKLKDTRKPDITRQKQKVDELLKQRDSLHNEFFEEKNKLENLNKGIAEITRLQKQLNNLEEEIQIVNNMKDIITGGYGKVTFKQFVIAAYLDEVLNAANLRLQKMSQNRYFLKRQTSNKEKNLLALGVFDEYNGEERDINTLSGGEGFMASLSMALGLSDVVQNFSGGIELNTIFIDEGFGSLDEETVQQAIDALFELSLSGRRMVGVISHVKELHERVAARIEVNTCERGSKVKVRV